MTNRPSPVRETALDGRSVRVLVTATLCMTAAVMPVVLTLILAVQIRRELSITPFQFGLAYTVYSAGIALFSFHLGRLADRVGWARGVLISLATSTLLLLAISLGARSIASLLPAMLIAGANAALAVPATALAIARELPTHRRGVTFGVKEAAISLATLLGGLAIPGVALTIGWRWAFVLAVVIPAVAFGLLSIDRAFLTTAQPSDTDGKRREGIGGSLKGIPAPFLLLTAGAGFAGASVAGIAGFAVLSAVDAGVDEAPAGLLIAAASLAGMASEIALGGLADRRRSGGFPETSAVLALGAVGYLVLATSTVPGAIAGTFLGYMFGWAFSGLMHLGAVTAHPESPASATAILQVGVGIGLTVGPITFGTLVDNSGYSLAWGAMAALALAAAAIFRIGAKRFTRAQPHVP